MTGIDTIEMQKLLPLFISRVKSETASADKDGENPNPIKFVDLGCGTGRNTLQLLYHSPESAHIVGLDASPGMLEIARSAMKDALSSVGSGTGLSSGESPSKHVKVEMEIFDLLRVPLCPPRTSLDAMGVISTLVLEHIPLQTFFEGAAAILGSGGYLLVTNMHSDMGSISQAGFVDPTTGVKVRPTSYCHSVPDVLEAAEACGFQIDRLGDEEVMERTVDEKLAETLGKRAKKWIGVKVWFAMCFRKV